MPNLATALKEEISRLARKEIKKYAQPTAQALARCRREILSLKRHVRDQEKKIAQLTGQERKRIGKSEVTDEVAEGTRFSARSVRAQRDRLAFSAAKYAQLIGVSPLTIYNWENGKSRPRKEQMAALIAVRGIGKREAIAKLESLLAEAEKGTATKARGRRRKSG